MLPQQIVYISIFTSLFANFFYIRDTFLGITKPNRASWFIWFLAPFLASLILFSKGGGFSAFPLFISSLTSLIVFIGSFKNRNAYWKLEKLDYICLFFALLAVVSWIFLKEGVLATIFAILADLIAFIPTYIKSWKAPETENLWPYYSGAFNSILSFITLTSISFLTAGFAIYFFVGCMLEITIVYFRKRKKHD